jgi:hypothetical protein
MEVVPESGKQMEEQEFEQGWKVNWMDVASAAALVAGGLLVLAGKRKAGTVAAASGAALLLIEQQELVRQCWQKLPEYIDKAQNVLGQVQNGVDEVEAKREQLHAMLHR